MNFTVWTLFLTPIFFLQQPAFAVRCLDVFTESHKAELNIDYFFKKLKYDPAKHTEVIRARALPFLHNRERGVKKQGGFSPHSPLLHPEYAVLAALDRAFSIVYK